VPGFQYQKIAEIPGLQAIHASYNPFTNEALRSIFTFFDIVLFPNKIGVISNMKAFFLVSRKWCLIKIRAKRLDLRILLLIKNINGGNIKLATTKNNDFHSRANPTSRCITKFIRYYYLYDTCCFSGLHFGFVAILKLIKNVRYFKSKKF
jgi:hypothetical protein